MLGASIVYSISKTKFFQEASKLTTVETLQVKPRSKGEYRRLRKELHRFRRARRRLLVLFIIHVFVFVSMYMSMLLTITRVFGVGSLVEIPIPIPLFTWRTASGSHVTYVHTLSLIGFLTPLYLFIRVVKR